VSLAIVFGLFALWLPFEGEPWSLYAALCVSYTILVFGLLWSDGKWRKYIVANQRKARDLVQGHTIFLLLLILWIWICRVSRPRLPDWMLGEIFRDLALTPYILFGGLGVVAVWWAEQTWLARTSKKEECIGVSPQ
jgi:hypothetical protein